jgi:hypothetical protein
VLGDPVMLDGYGEWVPAGVGLALAFLVASGGVIGLGWWVLRGDRLNRAAEPPDPPEGAEAH